MPVTLFIQERSGDFNASCPFETHLEARGAISFIIRQGGYWTDGVLDVSNLQYMWINDDRSIFIPLHRIDRMEIEVCQN